MQVEIRYWGQVETTAGQSNDVIDVADGASPGEVLVELAERRGPPLRDALLDEAGRPRSGLLLVVGDEQIGPDEAHPLRDGDTLTVMPPISGG